MFDAGVFGVSHSSGGYRGFLGCHGTPLSVLSELTEVFCNNTAGHIVIASTYYTHRVNRGEALANKTPYWLGYNYYSSDLRSPRGPRPRQFRVVVGGDSKQRPGFCRKRSGRELRRRGSARQSLRDTRGNMPTRVGARASTGCG